MRKERTHYTAEEKFAIRRRHLLDKVPVSDRCEELGFVLQAPSGQTFELIGDVTSDAGGSGFVNKTYPLDDSAATVIPNNGFGGAVRASGTCKASVSLAGPCPISTPSPIS
jgi:hypothetical protein